MLAATIGLGAASVLLPTSAFAAPATGRTAEHLTMPAAKPLSAKSLVTTPADTPPQSYCLYQLELNQPWTLGHCRGYEAGEAAGKKAGGLCWPVSRPKFPPYGEGVYGEGFKVGYRLAYRYYYNEAWTQAGCQRSVFKPFKDVKLR
ncbi:hypothetical protein [Streptomyces sp. ISL-94]|uniref:hypothetical protein n=1 Tax=Streptomyces sp. ISL-94 TaxID=2819190 RepID=UPI001BE65DA3|nr:hypothetical protein [Streptomyces sp. ISL-94]MBT2476844.1 hypothetical protein [Streptomyces sp. ISL-94]